jgi:ABC-type multidrug transport system fused ATPase/permease subunit
MALLAVTAWKALPAVNQILGSITSARNALPYISNEIDYFTLIEADKSINQNTSIQPLDFSKTIKFNNVGFSYQDNTREVIHDLSFEIEKGQTIGIIGTSGAGKSTLVDLLIGLLVPVKGTIQIDDQVLTRELLPKWLKITGYVSQSPYIYDGTLAENVAFGMDPADIDREQVRKCCTMASMDDFIHDLPDNIDSSIGERGVKLSGGQQQRVAIARALYSKPEVMIFDEATSSLDTNSEKAIQKTIYSFKGRQTLIIIAHRLTTVEDCDKVIWLEKGRIKMMGKPEEVLGVYNQGGYAKVSIVSEI